MDASGTLTQQRLRRQDRAKKFMVEEQPMFFSLNGSQLLGGLMLVVAAVIGMSR